MSTMYGSKLTEWASESAKGLILPALILCVGVLGLVGCQRESEHVSDRVVNGEGESQGTAPAAAVDGDTVDRDTMARDDGAGDDAAGDDAAGDDEAQATSRYEYRLIETDQAGLVEWIQAHPGELFFVNFWATWCAPCRAKFPAVVQLHERYHDRGVVIVSFSMDEPEVDNETVLEFLKSHNALFEHRIRNTPPEEALEDFGIREIPFSRLYSSDGEVLQDFSADQPDPFFDLAIRQHLDRMNEVETKEDRSGDD